MITVSSREFRANQKDYLDKAANGIEVLITRGKNEAFKIVKVSDDDTLMSKEAFYSKIEKAIDSANKGKTYSMNANETLNDFINRMSEEGNV